MASLFVVAAWVVPAGAAGAGSITGRVVGASDGTPVSGICVSLEKGPSTVTDGDGVYSLTGLDPGAYKLVFSDCNPTPRFRTQWYLQADTSGAATTVDVSDGVDTPLPDVALSEGVVVSGTVTAGGKPLADASVDVSPTDSGNSMHATTDVDGHYATEPLAPGDYRVRFADDYGSGAWAKQFWNGQPSWGTADTLTLTSSDVPERGGVDAALTASAQIHGTVTATDGSPLAGICVDANVSHDGSWDRVDGTTTGPDGTYAISGLPAASYAVRFSDCAGGHHVDQWYDGATGPDSATSVVLAAGEDHGGVDAQLGDGIAVAGRVTDSSGAPLAGISVSVNPSGSGQGGWAQTDADGNYRTGGVLPGDYRVQFSAPGPDPAWATQYWSGQLTWNTAQLLHVSSSDGPTHGGIDASMTPAARISGVVRGGDGSGIAGVCVAAVIDTPSGPDGANGSTTAADGSYTIVGLPATALKVVFMDCNNVGPYLQQWWQNQPGYSTATPINAAPGSSTTGVDATLQRAGAITGHVTDRSGDPLEGICVQASTDSQFGGLARTNSSGDYTITLAAAGSFRVQFVDCRDTPSFAGQWWDDQPTAASSALVPVVAGQTAPGVDAQLDPGAVATISGRVTSLRGAAMTSACVVAYLPDQYALFAPVAADGTYTIPGVPSGTYAVAALGCPQGDSDPSPIVPDPSVAGVSYQALWWNQVPLVFDQRTDGGPDPIAQHANLVAVTPGDTIGGRDFCFGCDAVAIQGITPSGDAVTLTYATPGLFPPDLQAAAEVPAMAYLATCSSTSGGVSRSASADGATVIVSGLTPGATYTCGVTASVTGVPIASSPETAAFAVAAGVNPADAPTAAAEPGSLAFTGQPLGRISEFAAALVLVGSVLVLMTRRRRAEARFGGGGTARR